ncbi:MAG: glycosyltransferase [Pseudomonadota bacterium]|nr:glycosyltransferase [Pseudomonadota bacterium]
MGLIGHVDEATRSRVSGWAFDPDRADLPVHLVVLANGEVAARGVADSPRPDVSRHLQRNGDFGYEFRLREPLPARERIVVEVRREEDGAALPNSPFVIEPSVGFDADTQAEWRSTLAAAQSDSDYESRIAFLADALEATRASYLKRRGGVEAREREIFDRWAGQALTPEPRQPRVLFIDERTPDPTRDAGSVAILSHMAALQRLGFAVSFVSVGLEPDVGPLAAIGVACYERPFVASVENLLERQRDCYSAIYLHRMSVASRYLELARFHQPGARIVYSVADLHHVRLARQAAAEQREELRAPAERARLRELTAAWAADAVVTHSPAEAKILQRHMLPAKIFVVPWAVEPHPVQTPFADRFGVAFIAGFGHSPNVDAAYELVDAIMPEIWKSHPQIKCLLVGADMPKSLRALASDRVEVIGAVADLAEVFERVRVTIAPLAFGAGLKGKVLDSLAAGVPCVCAPVAAEGFDFGPTLSELVGADAAELARGVVSMHEDVQANRAAADAGLTYVRTVACEAQIDHALRHAFKLHGAISSANGDAENSR